MSPSSRQPLIWLLTLLTALGWAMPFSEAAAPSDSFADAALLEGERGTVTGSNTGATKEPGEPNHANNAGGASVWWRFVAPGQGLLLVDTFGSDFDTTLAVYQGGDPGGIGGPRQQ